MFIKVGSSPGGSWIHVFFFKVQVGQTNRFKRDGSPPHIWSHVSTIPNGQKVDVLYSPPFPRHQSSYSQLMIGVSNHLLRESNPRDPITLSDDEQGVSNHLRKARYLGSITSLRRWARIPRVWQMAKEIDIPRSPCWSRAWIPAGFERLKTGLCLVMSKWAKDCHFPY